MGFTGRIEQIPEGLQRIDSAVNLRKGIKSYFKVVLVNI